MHIAAACLKQAQFNLPCLHNTRWFQPLFVYTLIFFSLTLVVFSTMMLKVALILSLAVATSAYCPNGCSGHGSCSSNPKDTCVCYKRRESRALLSTLSERSTDMVDAWTGADCSLRTCPKGYAWAASPIDDNSHKQLVECSGKGNCDRKSGECKCFDGFWGEGCRRSACPNE